jgi:hypothetical protein
VRHTTLSMWMRKVGEKLVTGKELCDIVKDADHR